MLNQAVNEFSLNSKARAKPITLFSRCKNHLILFKDFLFFGTLVQYLRQTSTTNQRHNPKQRSMSSHMSESYLTNTPKEQKKKKSNPSEFCTLYIDYCSSLSFTIEKSNHLHRQRPAPPPVRFTHSNRWKSKTKTILPLLRENKQKNLQKYLKIEKRNIQWISSYLLKKKVRNLKKSYSLKNTSKRNKTQYNRILNVTNLHTPTHTHKRQSRPKRIRNI